MKIEDARRVSRRRFLEGLTLAGTTALLGLHARRVAAEPPPEPPPETTKIRLAQISGICVAPQYIAEELLRAEGFTEVQYVKFVANPYEAYASGEIDISMAFVAPFIVQADKELPIVLLGGVHVGCFELFGTSQVHSIGDLKGKTVAVPELGSAQHAFLASMLVHVGLNPQKDINWVTHPTAESARLLAERKVDALVGFPPVPQELRAKQIGHVIVNSTVDRPWSQYFCCMVVSNREFVRKHPVATKRALRALLKAADFCALEPELAAQSMVSEGFTQDYDFALQSLQEIPYNRWRTYDPEDTVRFYALRLHEAGMIRSSPQKIIAEGTDWRFFNELKKELKG